MGNIMKQMFAGIMAAAADKVEHHDGDYIGDDGLLYCGKCHTPKQCRITLEGMDTDDGVRTPYIMCDCQREAEERRRAEEERQQAMEAVKNLRVASLMDERFAKATFADCTVNRDNSQAIKLCRAYVDKFDIMLSKNQGLLLYGEPGTGKSFAAACIANALMERQIPVVMTSFVKIMSAVGSRSVDEERLIGQMREAKLLIIDDLGAERGTDYASEKVYNFVDSRYRSSLPMIVTTNLTLDEITRAGDVRQRRIYERIIECCYPIEFAGTSWRVLQAADRYDQMRNLLEG